MIIVTESKLKEMVRKELSKAIKDCVIELDSNKQYILVLPTDISPSVSREALEQFQGSLNIVVLHADYVKLIEMM